MARNPMVLFFPQYQAGYVPSNIPVGTPSLRDLWKDAPGFVEVPLQPTDDNNPETEGNIRFRRILNRQLQDALAIVEKAKPDFILTTGGDCGASFVPIAYMNKLHDGKIGVIWVDAHGDIHLPSTTPSQNYHGMIFRNLMGHKEFDVQPELPLRTDQVAYLGLRDTEAAEDAFIEQNAIPRFDAAQVMKGNEPLDAVIAHFKKHGITHLHLHVDCDVMDEKVFPHVHVPESGGLTLDRLLEILQYLRKQMPMAGCCLTEYAPATPAAGLDIVKRVYAEGLGLTLPAA
jgi:arginase